MADEKPERPNMEGYLRYKNEAINGDRLNLEAEEHRAWRDNLFREKPPIVHYRQTLKIEEELKEKGEYENPKIAIATGKRAEEIRPSFERERQDVGGLVVVGWPDD